VAVLTAVYFIDALFNLFLVMKSLKVPPEMSSTEEELRALDETTLPVYSVLCPLYKEAHMLPTFVTAMQALDWPKAKLDVLLLLEENDQETVIAAEAMNLPSYIRIVVVPHSMPKTKPKACNYGLSFASGEYVVIYDAEDIPEPAQLKKAYLGFQNSDPSVRCLQAKLNYFNPHQNLLTRLFTAEYSLWFDVILPGLQSINTSLPLGGTSNHFRTRDLLELEGWDPFNVTEDCDLGARIFKRGYRTAIIDSVTLEEANSDVKNWIRQRSRWIKGYMQTYLVHMRHPFQFVRENGWHALIFQLVVGGKIGFMFINPFLWLATLSYFTLTVFVGPAIEALFPPLVFYFAALSLVFGNFLYLYYYMIGTAKREHFQVVKYVFLIPFYWFLVSYAAFIGLYQLIAKPHYWEKTMHGLHMKKKKEKELAVRTEAVRSSPTVSTHGEKLARERLFFRIIPKSLTHFFFSSKGLLIGAMLLGNVLNFIFNAYLGRVLTFSELNIVVFVNTLWIIMTVVVGGFSSTTNHRVSYLLAHKGTGAMWAFFLYNLKCVTGLFVGVSLFWIFLSPVLASFFHVENVMVLVFFTPAILFGFLSYNFQGFLKGGLYFPAVAVVTLTEAFSKL
jgi:cellulose synthase/poly-beta-1,6-N-acetylglucosamine synthase-like glycosyltransferase